MKFQIQTQEIFTEKEFEFQIYYNIIPFIRFPSIDFILLLFYFLFRLRDICSSFPSNISMYSSTKRCCWILIQIWSVLKSLCFNEIIVWILQIMAIHFRCVFIQPKNSFDKLIYTFNGFLVKSIVNR